MSEESTGTVLVAAAANLGLAAAKFLAGIASGSSAMLSEAAHSVGDTVNQVLLLVAIRRSGRPPDRDHPFGYGMERYFWSLLAAVGVFVLGAGFAAYQGISTLLGGGEQGPAGWALLVLGVAFLLEGGSFVRAVWQLRRDAAASGTGARTHLQDDADPALRAVVWEDGAALLGLLLAAAGVGLASVTGSSVWDGVASLLIAALLVAVAYDLGRRNRDALIGVAASPAVTRDIRERIAGSTGVDHVLEVLTIAWLPTSCWSRPGWTWPTTSPPRSWSTPPTTSSDSSASSSPTSGTCSWTPPPASTPERMTGGRGGYDGRDARHREEHS